MSTVKHGVGKLQRLQGLERRRISRVTKKEDIKDGKKKYTELEFPDEGIKDSGYLINGKRVVKMI